ncbi:hypothetical protein AAG570_012588 [Ranatra chinensis]|uniref:Uncharacterized protein n=1 Tax=Ranatra chinensis TaxID=642074 RepID=A0ABD0YWS9_9HEMI
MILKPTWTYGIELCGSAKKSNIDTIQSFHSKTLHTILDDPDSFSATSRGPDGVVVSVCDYHAKGPGFDSLRGYGIEVRFQSDDVLLGAAGERAWVGVFFIRSVTAYLPHRLSGYSEPEGPPPWSSTKLSST